MKDIMFVLRICLSIVLLCYTQRAIGRRQAFIDIFVSEGLEIGPYTLKCDFVKED